MVGSGQAGLFYERFSPDPATMIDTQEDARQIKVDSCGNWSVREGPRSDTSLTLAKRHG